MEVELNAERLLGCNFTKNKVSLLLPHLLNSTSTKEQQLIGGIVDEIGVLSSRAQELKSVITTFTSFMNNSDQKIFIHATGTRVNGFLKTGYKNLFVVDPNSLVKEIKPLCVLDFYVHESQQRNGLGKLLFQTMLSEEKIEPSKIAYDRPSSKLIAFLSKHYDLVRYTPQNNNFVVFHEYFNYPDQGSRGLTKKIIKGGKLVSVTDNNPSTTEKSFDKYQTPGKNNQGFSNLGKQIIQSNYASDRNSESWKDNLDDMTNKFGQINLRQNSNYMPNSYGNPSKVAASLNSGQKKGGVVPPWAISTTSDELESTSTCSYKSILGIKKGK